jgi:hypothetical protein
MMPSKVACLLAGSIASLAFSHSHELTSGNMAVEAERTRMSLHKADTEHRESLAAIASRMTLASALQVLHGKTSAKPLLGLVSKALHGDHKRKSGTALESKNLRASSDRTGYDGLDKARKMLNEMLEDTRTKYDDKQEECCAYDDQQSKLIELCRTDMAIYDEASSGAREEVAEAQMYIDRDTIQLPAEKEALEEHKQLCHKEITDLEWQLHIVMTDVAIMNTILGMMQCDEQQLLLLTCVDECTGASRVSFRNTTIQKTASQLQSSTVRRLLDDALAGAGTRKEEPADKEEVSTQTVAPTEVPENNYEKRSGPCSLPVSTDGNTGKCSPSASPNCQRMQDKFESIKCGMDDKQVELEQRLSYKNKYCDSKTEHATGVIIALEMSLKNWQKNLMAGTAKQSNGEEGSRKKSAEKDELDKDYQTTTENCHAAYRVFENDWCALVKIRTELYKMKSDEPAFFQDCEVSEWVPEDCSEPCAGGVQALDRTISSQPDGGAACPALKKTRECNTHKCPIDCVVADWDGWSACNVHCGGGIMTRLRRVERDPVHGGEPCGETADSISCDMQACDEPCELSDWTDWGECNKQCDGGLAARIKRITVPSIGAGICATSEQPSRLTRRNCNMIVCPTKEPVLKCESALDLVLLLDGSAAVGEDGFDKIKATAKLILESFEGDSRLSQVSLILYSYSVEVKMYLSNDIGKAMGTIADLKWPQHGLSFLSWALYTASTMLSSGSRPEAESVVVVITGSHPPWVWFTWWASLHLKHIGHARLTVLAVGNQVPMGFMKWVVSLPLENNLMHRDTWDELAELPFVNNVIASICRHVI